MMTMPGERKGLSIHFAVLLFLSFSFCDGFEVHRSLRSNVLTVAHVADEAAGLGEASNGDVIILAAAAITKESCRLLGIKSLGVDYGLVRSGVAATVGYDPTPLRILSNLNNTELSQHIVEICRSEQASQVIVGLPLHKNGTEANQTTITRMFAAELADNLMRNLVRVPALTIRVFRVAFCRHSLPLPLAGARCSCATIRREIHIQRSCSKSSQQGSKSKSARATRCRRCLHNPRKLLQ